MRRSRRSRLSRRSRRTRAFWPAAVCAALIASPGARAAGRPNVLLIMADDLGKDWIGCCGAGEKLTPNIDRLAAAGMRFRRAWSMPQCTPTRVTLLTGQYPWRTGWVNHWDVPRWGVGYFDWRVSTTFARVLRDAGYATAIAGKWQINDFRIEPEALRKHGFDDWCVWTGFETGNPPSARRYHDPYIHTRSGSRTRAGAFGPDVFCEFLIDFMRRHRDRPMLLYYPMVLTHGPLVATPGEPGAAGKLGKFRAMVRHTDRLVGKLVAELDRLGLRERTVVIFTTDNGTAGSLLGTVGGKRPSGGKGTKYEGGVCMPFIVSSPGRVPSGAVSDALTDFTDIFPTLLELAGADPPPGLEIDGRSIAPVLLGAAKDGVRSWIMALGHGPARLDEEGVRGRNDYADRVVRGPRFKVWVDTGKRIAALYDLAADPLERRNLLAGGEGALDGEARRALERLRAVVEATPDRDARPRYRRRAPRPWDRKPEGERRRRPARGKRAGS